MTRYDWVAVDKCREQSARVWNFGNDDDDDKALFEDWKRQVGATLCSRDSGITFIPRSKTSSWVIRDDCPWAIGWIGFTDIRDNKVGGWKPTYVVNSWAVENEKYGVNNSNRHSKTSSVFDTALKLAKRYLRRPSPIMMSSIKQGSLAGGIRKEFDKVRSENNRATEKVVDISTSMYGNVRQNNKRLFKELKHLIDMGHEFLDPQFESDVRAMVNADQVMGDSAVENIPFYCVMTYESRGQTVFDVVKGTQVNPYSAEVEEQYNRFTEDMLPEEITRKLAVLQMLDSEDYVDGVGVSVGGGIYYVLAD